MAIDGMIDFLSAAPQFKYAMTKKQNLALNVSLLTKKPLLLIGPRGSGKRTLAKTVGTIWDTSFHNYDLDRLTTAANIRDFLSSIEGSQMPTGIYLMQSVETAQQDTQNAILDCWSTISGPQRLLILTSTLTAEIPEDMIRSTVYFYMEDPDEDQLKSIALLHYPRISRKDLDMIIDNYKRAMLEQRRFAIVDEFLNFTGMFLRLAPEKRAKEGYRTLDELSLFTDKPSDFELQSEPEIFVSYSRADSELVDKLTKALKRLDQRVWVDQGEIDAGEDWSKSIDYALESCITVLVILSPDSVRSDQVRAEWTRAMQIQKRIIPIVIKSCVIPIRLSIYQYIEATELSPDKIAKAVVKKASGWQDHGL